MLGVVVPEGRPAPAQDDVAGDHRRCRDEQRDAEHRLELALHVVTERLEQEGPAERGGDRSGAQPPDQAEVHGAVVQVHTGTERLHRQCGDEVARYRRERLDPEPQDEDRGHERAATHSGEADDEPDTQAREGDPPVHCSDPPVPVYLDVV